MPQIDSTYFITQVFWLFVTFSLCYIFVSRFFIPKIESIMTSRSEGNRSLMKEAESYREKNEAFRLEIEEILNEAKDKAKFIKKNASEEATILVTQKIKELQGHLDFLILSESKKLKQWQDDLNLELPILIDEAKNNVLQKLFQSNSNIRLSN